MQLYDKFDVFPGDKQCKSTLIDSEDKMLKLTILYEYMPEKSKIWTYICLEILTNNRDPDRFIENNGADTSKFDFKRKMYKWFKYINTKTKYRLSWYTTKKMMILASKAIERVFR